MASIESLSNEVLEEILLYLPGSSMPALMFVCKQFDEVISSSVKLMENFEVQWTKNKELDMRPLFRSVRKYRKLQLLDVVGLKPNLHRFISNHGSTLTALFFYECSMTTSDLSRIVSMVSKNLKEFNMCEVNIEKDAEASSCKLPQLKMMELMYGRGDGYVSMLPIFADARIKRFQYEDDYEMSDDEIKVFGDFLASQSELKEFSLTCNVTQQLFADTAFSSAVSFQAEQIFLWMSNPMILDGLASIEPVIEIVTNFLESQRDSLKTLTLGRCMISNQMASRLLKLKMKDFRIVQCQFVWNELLGVTNQTVEKIFLSMHETVDPITERAIGDIFKSCYNIKSMKFACVEMTFELAMSIAYGMENLKKLHLFRCDFLPITFPNLEDLEVVSCDLPSVLRLLRVNRHLKSLKVPSSYNVITSFHQALAETKIQRVKYD